MSRCCDICPVYLNKTMACRQGYEVTVYDVACHLWNILEEIFYIQNHGLIGSNSVFSESAHLMMVLAAFGALFLVTAVIVVLNIYIKR